MSDQSNESGKKVLSLAPRGTLKLDTAKPAAAPAGAKPAADGIVRQSFSHGRSKTVAVEVKKKRAPVHETPAPAASSASVAAGSTRPAPRPVAPRQLTEQEREARARALRALKDNETSSESKPALPSIAELNRPVAPPPPPPAQPAAPAKPLDRDALRKQEMEEMKRIKEQERHAATQAELKRQQEENAKRRAEADRAAGKTPETPDERRRPGEAAAALPGRFANQLGLPARGLEDDGRGGARRGRTSVGRPRGDTGSDRVNVDAALAGEDNVRRRSVASMRRRAEKARQHYQQQEPKEKIVREVVLPEVITVQELANRMAEKGADVVKTLMKMGMLVTITQTIDADTAELVAGEFGHKIKRVTEADVLEGLGGTPEDDAGEMQSRPPVVTIMGHVDHGKTSLLDALRKTQVAAGEAGGITQHIGAYQITLPKGGKVTFIDTPGHAAFSEMRARGANVTDIVVLVVAADDGIMPQTIEAISHARAAKVPIIVAINKCDLPGADPQRVRSHLLQHDLVVEQMGGEVLDVEVSAKKGTNLDKLLESILLQAEVLDLKANPARTAHGTVIEAKMEKGRGSVATVLVQAGTLKQGDIFVAGSEWGRVRVMLNDRGETVTSASPAMPVEVLGLTGTPEAGDDFTVVASEARAREVAEYRARKRRELASAAAARGSLDQMFAQIKAGEVKELPIVIKGDVHGSIEAIAGALAKLTSEGSEVKARVLHAGVGPITESDVTLAGASKAFIIGFNVRANPQAREIAKRDGLEIRYYSVIYQVIDDVKAALTGMLKPTLREKFIGYASIREVFNITKVGKVAGCMVTEGVVKRGAGVRLLRDNVVVHTGTLKTLKRFKDEVKEVKEGFECGMAFENYDDIQTGDVIEAFEIEEIARELS